MFQKKTKQKNKKKGTWIPEFSSVFAPETSGHFLGTENVDSHAKDPQK